MNVSPCWLVVNSKIHVFSTVYVLPASLILMVTLAALSEVSLQAHGGTAMPTYLCLWLMDLILKLKKTTCVSSLVR